VTKLFSKPGTPGTHPARAAQAWQILVGLAMNRQTVTYEGLSLHMYRKKAAGVLDEILGHIVAYCKDGGNNLPLLTAIVVGKRRGTPGDAIPVGPAKMDREREKVYEYDWYNLRPPSEEDLQEAWKRSPKDNKGRLADFPN
jgi:hypothetical protein